MMDREKHSSLLEKAWAAIKSPWALLALSVVGAALLAWWLNGMRAADREELAKLRRENDERVVELARVKGALVLKEAEASELRARADALSPVLASSLARIEELTGKLEVLSVVHAWTAPVVVADVIRGNAAASTGGQPPNLAEGQGPGAKPESPTGACPPYLLGAEHSAAIEVVDVRAETRGRARVALGEAWLWQTAPERRRLLGGPWSAGLSEASAAPPPAIPGGAGWGGGLFAAAGSCGGLAGPAVAFPPIFGALEFTGSGGANLDGGWALAGTLVWRPGR